MTKRKLEQLRMLADWQLIQLGYDPAEITQLCQQADDCSCTLNVAARQPNNTKGNMQAVESGLRDN